MIISKSTLLSFFGHACLVDDVPKTRVTGRLPLPAEIRAREKAGVSASGFFDIHCHILPQLDEGPRTLEESLRMIQIAREDGVSGVVATPHIIRGIYNNTKENIAESISQLKVSASHPEIFLGAEIRLDKGLAERIDGGELPLINNRNFVLLELPPYVIPPLVELEKIVKGLVSRNIIPIFAHPERNVPITKDLSIMERLVRCGALFQVTAASLRDSVLKRLTLKMIAGGYVHVVASDAHDALKRPPVLSPAYEIISRKFDSDIARRLLTYNPLKIIQGGDID